MTSEFNSGGTPRDKGMPASTGRGRGRPRGSGMPRDKGMPASTGGGSGRPRDKGTPRDKGMPASTGGGSGRPRDKGMPASTGGGSGRPRDKGMPRDKGTPRDKGMPASTGGNEKFEIIVESSHYKLEPWKEFPLNPRHSVTLTVEPSLTIASLKSMLEPYPWIPKENLVLFLRGGGINAPLCDSSTLQECGVENRDVLFACMEGSFKVKVYCFYPRMLIRFSVDSCFQTVEYIKEKIYQKRKIPPEDQVISAYKTGEKMEDGTPLVAVGVVKPYLEEMNRPNAPLKLAICKQLQGPMRCSLTH